MYTIFNSHYIVGRGMTVVKHDHGDYGFTSTPGQSDGCDGAGCFHDKIHYGPSMTEIESLLHISSECHQTILNNCTNNPLSHVAWWIDRHGQVQEYWDGDHETGFIGCYCSLHGNGCSENVQGDSVSFCIFEKMSSVEHIRIYVYINVPVFRPKFGFPFRC